MAGVLGFLAGSAAETTGNFMNKVGLVKRATASKMDSTNRLDGRTIVLTGGNRGIGKEVARELARRGAHLVLGCRDATLAKQTVDEILKETPQAAIVVHKLDLASVESINYFAQTVLDTERTVDILINNAGLIATTKRVTDDGHEMNFGTNHLGHFLLTLLLLERIKQSPVGKIINYGSTAHLCKLEQLKCD